MADNKVYFGKWESIALIILTICYQIYLNMPRLVVETAGTAGWLLVLYVSILGFAIYWLILRLYKRHKGLDLIDIGEYVAGAPGRIITGTIILVYLIFITSVVLREFSENVKIISLQVSPISFVSLFFLGGMIIGTYLGLEAIVRFNAIMVPIIFVSYLLILIGVSKYFNITKLAPILGFGSYELFVKGISKISLFSGSIVIYFIAPYLNSYKILKKAGYLGFLISAILLFTSAVSYLLVYTYPIATENFLPMYQLSRLFSYGRFFERFESIFLIFWIITAFLYLTITMFFIVFFFKKTFKLDYYRPLILPFAVIILNLSLLPENLVTAINLETEYFRNLGWIVAFGLPITLQITSLLVKKRGESYEGKKEK
jgi:spore germination protein (amino acid permease)